jgi:DNA-binding response OmpR family regulator
MRVLIVEDEAQLAATIVRVLRRQGIAADAAHDGDAAITQLARDVYDVVVLDRNLPGISGDEVCRRLVARGGQPRILMLTARDAVSERVAGLDLGADDYVPKPVTMAELVARIRALARRPEASLAPILRWGDLTLDSGRRVATRCDRSLALTRRELAVLEELLRAQGAVVSADRLLSRAWDDSHGDPFENTVRVTVMRLRRKLGEPSPVETVVGSGYRMR